MPYFVSDEAQQWFSMLSAQLLLVVFDLAYDLSTESLQISRIEPLHYNKQYSRGITDYLIRQKLIT